MPTPQAVYVHQRHVNYRGDLTGQIEGQVLGPNMLGECLVIESTTYDAWTDRTAASLRYATADDLR